MTLGRNAATQQRAAAKAGHASQAVHKGTESKGVIRARVKGVFLVVT
jgi:hypothetical protein